MANFKVGYAKANINPPLGIDICGYYIPRLAKGFLDDLEVGALALQSGDNTALIIAVDNIGIGSDHVNKITEAIEKACGVSKDSVLICASHTHTGPFTVPGAMGAQTNKEIVERYAEFMCQRIVDAAVMATNDLKCARMGYTVTKAPDRIAYIRRYKMKDGTTMTCPPINDPNIDHPLGELDQRVNVLRFDRDGAPSIALVNYGIHSDTIGGELISADFESWLRKTVNKALDGVECMFVCGAQGDVGSTHVYPTESDMNDTEISFDNEMKSPGMARFVGRALAGTVLQVWDKVQYTDVDEIRLTKKIVPIAANLPKPEELPLAHKYKELHDAGRDDLIPYTAMELTTVVAEACRMCALENGPENFMLPMTAMSLGPVAFVSIPGEPFTDIGVKIKEAEGWELIIPCALTNGNFGYFPVQSAYDEGGYEARSTKYRAGVAESLINAGKELLEKIRK